MRWWMRLRTRRWAAGALLGALLAAAAGTSVALMLGGESSPGAAAPPSPDPGAPATASPTDSPAAVPTPVRFGSILDGSAMSEADWQARKGLLPLAVMIDNSPQALPQAGLAEADLVYEALVEGGITRFMAVYWSKDPELVEPVRSARTPFVVWASELGALYAHAGGAETFNDANAIGQIYDWGIADLEAFVPPASSAFFRTDDRFAPHNLAASGKALREASDELAYSGPAALEPWPFKADGGTDRYPAVGAFEVDFGSRRTAGGVIQWRWDAGSRSWLRFQMGGPALDAATGTQLAFRNVVVMRAPHEAVDDSGHVLYDQFGEGEAAVFLDGREIPASWRKKDRESRTRFYAADGSEIAFNRGPIFIEVVGPESLLFTATSPDGLGPLPAYEPPPPAPPEDTSEPEEPTATPSGTAKPSTTPGKSPSATGTPRSTPSGTPGGSDTPEPRDTETPESTDTPEEETPLPSDTGTPEPEQTAIGDEATVTG